MRAVFSITNPETKAVLNDVIAKFNLACDADASNNICHNQEQGIGLSYSSANGDLLIIEGQRQAIQNTLRNAGVFCQLVDLEKTGDLMLLGASYETFAISAYNRAIEGLLCEDHKLKWHESMRDIDAHLGNVQWVIYFSRMLAHDLITATSAYGPDKFCLHTESGFNCDSINHAAMKWINAGSEEANKTREFIEGFITNVESMRMHACYAINAIVG